MQNVKTVYLVRHGESVANTEPFFQSLGSPLSESGVAQADVVADRISKLQFEALISSTLERAKTTASAISKKTDREVEFSELFRERIKPASIYGKPYNDPGASAVWRKWEESLVTSGMKVEDGEGYDEIVKRADDALNFLLNHPVSSIVVVTHGYFMRTIVARVLFGEFLTDNAFANFQRATSSANTGITVIRHHDAFEEEAQWRLWVYNDHAHLG